jgi:hypothetical protein
LNPKPTAIFASNDLMAIGGIVQQIRLASKFLRIFLSLVTTISHWQVSARRR